MIDELRKALESLDFDKGFADLRLTEVQSTSVLVRNGVIEQTTHTHTRGIAARVLMDGAWGFYSTSDVTKESAKSALLFAKKMADVASHNVREKADVFRERTFIEKVPIKVKVDPRNVPVEEKIKVASDFERNIRTVDERIASSSTSVYDGAKVEIVLNTLGSEVRSESCFTAIFGSATSREGALTQNVRDGVASTEGWETIENFDTTEKGVQLGMRARDLLSASPPPSGKMSIVMDPSLVGVYIHEAFGHAAEADAIKAEMSVLAGKLGKKVGSETISVYDDPTIPGAAGSFVFDSEGTRATRRKIVENGILTEYLHSLETAAWLKTEPNGAARAMDFSSPPIVRMSNTFVAAGDMELEELFELVKNGVYLIKSYGGYVDPARGQFLFSAQGGYFIKDGELGESIQNVSMSGMTLEVLEKTIGVGKKMELAFPGACGKGGQSVSVDGGGPNLAVKDIVVGGRGS
ncbi:MAG: TldD/PmbA family protein [Thermoproteota archaeon]